MPSSFVCTQITTAFGKLTALWKRVILVRVSKPNYSIPFTSISSSQSGGLAQRPPAWSVAGVCGLREKCSCHSAPALSEDHTSARCKTSWLIPAWEAQRLGWTWSLAGPAKVSEQAGWYSRENLTPKTKVWLGIHILPSLPGNLGQARSLLSPFLGTGNQSSLKGVL